MNKLTKINCLVVDDEPLAREVVLNYIERIDALECMGSCANALEAFNLLATQAIDLIFLDIQMPEISGIDFLKELNPAPQVIFTTSYSEFAVEAFSLEATDYLLKPIEFSRFLKAVNKVFKQLALPAPPALEAEPASDLQEAFIYLKVERQMQKVFLKDILYIESLRNHIRVKTTEREIVAYKSLSAIEETLPTRKFLRVHRSFIVGLDFVEAFSPSNIQLKGSQIPVGRYYKDTVKKVLGYR
ncbi:MAG TPA: DNA-binding response regulator [Microscillaceae bacterium]|nr:DNA-binding response regulator [Microscillaceae bacterium]